MTELDLRHSLVPEEIIHHLKQSLPPVLSPNDHHSQRTNGEDGGLGLENGDDADVQKYDYIAFMQNITANNPRPPPHGSGRAHAAGGVGEGVNGIRNGLY